MKNTEKNVYISLSLELLSIKREDVISTSGFNGDEHIIGGEKNQSASFEL